MVKYKVKVGTLKFEQGTFQAGDIIDVTDERAKLFDVSDIEAATQTCTVTPTLNTTETPTPATAATFTEKPSVNNAPTFIEKPRKATRKK